MNREPQETVYVNYSKYMSKDVMRFSHKAMATVFEIFIIHEDISYAEQCVFQAFSELDRLEQELSRFVENSDISKLNSCSRGHPVKVGIDTFRCLEECIKIFKDTNKAFDITVGPLLKCWINEDRSLRESGVKQVENAGKRVGADLITPDKRNFTVTLNSDSMIIDLGGYGKGYAIDRVVEILKEWEVEHAFIHGGASSIYAVEPPPNEEGWEFTISDPADKNKIISRYLLRSKAISGSGTCKSSHIINTRTGYPVKNGLAAWAIGNTAAECDALSTAFMIMSAEEIENLCRSRNDIQAVKITEGSKNESNVMFFGENRE
ncbi:FAD:protein FMN transferase [candidate division KSB1 bacterium]